MLVSNVICTVCTKLYFNHIYIYMHCFLDLFNFCRDSLSIKCSNTKTEEVTSQMLLPQLVNEEDEVITSLCDYLGNNSIIKRCKLCEVVSFYKAHDCQKANRELLNSKCTLLVIIDLLMII